MLTVLPVQGFVKNYDWGKVGEGSYIAKFKSAEQQLRQNLISESKFRNIDATSSKEQDAAKPLAELWFGAHPSGPSTVIAGNQSIRLDEFLAKEPGMVGHVDHYYKYNKKLPFLFKILSISKPLSLQAHPDKKLAQVLHQRDPTNYPDANHKPELAIALTEFEVLCDFRPSKEIRHFMNILPPFRRIVGEANCDLYSRLVNQNESIDKLKSALSSCFKALMTRSESAVARESTSLLADQQSCATLEKDLNDLVTHLMKMYPGDPGIFAPFFLNHLKLKAGQAIYLKANKLHAYIRGECIECMACSDNVVRAGLTKKFRDVDTLMSMLDYETVHSAKDVILEGLKHKYEPAIVSFGPTDEFKVDRITITEAREFEVPSVASGSFVIVLEGKVSTRDFFDYKKVHDLAPGSAGFVPPKVAIKLYKIQSPLTLYRAYC